MDSGIKFDMKYVDFRVRFWLEEFFDKFVYKLIIMFINFYVKDGVVMLGYRFIYFGLYVFFLMFDSVNDLKISKRNWFLKFIFI